ncbi:hypothetical protein I3760_10G036200 [Carya illinoinensis]|nr:hypothetical protein I3760_10G036200 [Carya illinoinensis]
MAGLQYNFFPTDFFYPRPQSAPLDATRKAVLPIQEQKDVTTNDSEGPKTLVQKNLVKFQTLVQKQHDHGQSLHLLPNQPLSKLQWTPQEPTETS